MRGAEASNPVRRIRSRSAFTLIEVMLALLLSTVVLGAAMGVLQLLIRSQQIMGDHLDRTVQLTVAQEALRRTMDSLVGGIPLLPPDESNPEDDLDEDFDDEEREEELRERSLELADRIRELVDDPRLADELIRQALAPRVQFELFFDETRTDGLYPVLEVVVARSPLPPGRSLLQTEDEFDAAARTFGELADRPELLRVTGTVRGRFELAWRGDDLVLQWVWMDDPFLEPRVLIRGVTWCQWLVMTDKREYRQEPWQEVWAAYLADDFPVAVRLILTTNTGAQVDWLFETSVFEPEDF